MECILEELNSPTPFNGIIPVANNLFSISNCCVNSVGLLNLPNIEASSKNACGILSPADKAYTSESGDEILIPFIKVLYR